MKKILAATAIAVALSSSSAIAETDNMFYIGADAGALFMNQAKVAGNKFKSKTSATFDAKVGYYVMDNTRVELAFGMPVSPELKLKGVQGSKGKLKGDVYALFLNGYVDLFDASIAKVFIGAGVGPSKVQAKTSITDSNGVASSAKSKNTTTFAYNVSVGASAELTPGVNVEYAYRWTDYGKSKAKKVNGVSNNLAASFKGSNVVLGVRLDI
jgi:opacity protein-like surface antigen